jgi:hypothetical protein
MSQWLWNRNILTWGRVVSFGRYVVSFVKGGAVFCAFVAFALNMRQKELDRFHTIKPLFEIETSTNANSFRLLNHGGIVHFIGCDEKNAGELLKKTPRQYSYLGNNQTGPVKFEFLKQPSNGDSIVLYWRDIDLNTYKLTIKWEKDGFYIGGVPLVFRSKQLLTTSIPWLDSITNFLVPKDWFSDEAPPTDDQLKVAFNNCLRKH